MSDGRGVTALASPERDAAVKVTCKTSNKSAARKSYPPIPTTLQTLLKAWKERGLCWNDPAMQLFVSWFKRYRKVLIPKKSESYVSERHVVFREAGIYIVYRRTRWYYTAGNGIEVKEYEDLEIAPLRCKRAR